MATSFCFLSIARWSRLLKRLCLTVAVWVIAFQLGDAQELARIKADYPYTFWSDSALLTLKSGWKHQDERLISLPFQPGNLQTSTLSLNKIFSKTAVHILEVTAFIMWMWAAARGEVRFYQPNHGRCTNDELRSWLVNSLRMYFVECVGRQSLLPNLLVFAFHRSADYLPPGGTRSRRRRKRL